MSKCTRKAKTEQAVQQGMEQHEGLVHALIQRQGGGELCYEEALQTSPSPCRRCQHHGTCRTPLRKSIRS